MARKILRKLDKAGSERCRANKAGQSRKMRNAIERLSSATAEARAGFASVLTDALGTRSLCSLGDLAKLYERMEADRLFFPMGESSGTPDTLQGSPGA